MANAPVPSSQTFATQKPLDRFAGERVFKDTANFEKPTVLAKSSVAAAGSSQADAAQIPLVPFVEVTAADGTKGVILPVCGPGTVIRLHNTANAVLKVYPHSGGDLNDGTQDAAGSVAAKTPADFVNLDGTTWSARYV